MSQASSSYLSFPQIHLSAFKQHSMQLTEKWFLMASPVTRATQLLDSTTVSTVIPIQYSVLGLCDKGWVVGGLKGWLL